MTAQFNIYEVEHQGDEQLTIADLAKAGCTDIIVLGRDYEGETIRVSCELPEGMTSFRELESKLEFACL